MQQQIDQIATDVMQQQGLVFDTIAEAERYKSGIVQKLDESVQLAQTHFFEGLHLLRHVEQHFVKATVNDLLAHRTSPAEINNRLAAILRKEPRAEEYFCDAVNSFFDCGDFHREQCVLTVLLALFPTSPQAFVYFATLFWRQYGIATAITFYNQCVDVFQDPLLDYFAAECFKENGDLERAKALNARALATLEALPPESSSELTLHLQALVKQRF